MMNKQQKGAEEEEDVKSTTSQMISISAREGESGQRGDSLVVVVVSQRITFFTVARIILLPWQNEENGLGAGHTGHR